MENKNVWKIICNMDVPNDRRLIGCKWVFKIKRDGTYRARLVALGYSQVPGVDFTDNFSPVVNDVTFRVALARRMMEDLKCMLRDVEIKEDIYMKVPVGMKEVFSSSDEAGEENNY